MRKKEPTLSAIWSNADGRYLIQFPEEPLFYIELEQQVKRGLSRDPATKGYLIDECDLEAFKTLAKSYFPNMTLQFIAKPNRNGNGNGNINSVAAPQFNFEKFLRLLPQEELKILYRKAIMNHHPDHGGNHDDMVVLNTVWTELSK
jgi:hypothetical protein